jgi:hypothetical protein
MEVSMNSSSPLKDLSQVVHHLILSSSPSAVRKGTLIINDIPSFLCPVADEHMLATIVSGMLNTMITNGENSCIRISAKVYEDIVQVEVKDSCSCNSYAVVSRVQSFQPLAEKIGGYLSISSQHEKVMVITFSFPNVMIAA